MTENTQGDIAALAPDHKIESMIKDGQVIMGDSDRSKTLQPASLDLSFDKSAWRLRASFLPGKEMRVADRLSAFAMHEMDLSKGAALETGCVYLVKLAERLELPESTSAIANAKSSSGRLDLFVRLITDYGTSFDQVPPGYCGPLYAEISPRTFSVLVGSGTTVNQMRFLIHNDEAREYARQKMRAISSQTLSVDLSSPAGGLVGWRAKPHSAMIDLNRVGEYEISEFWEPIYPRKEGGIILDPDAFYILRSYEPVSISPDFAAEMAPFIATIGEFRVHYAGFFDPGFGASASGGEGARAVLEVRCRETPFALEHRQIVGLLKYEPLLSPPTRLYGPDIGSNYQAQDLKLSKHFKTYS